MIAFCVCLILREFWWLQLVLNPKSDYLRSNWKRANISLSYILLATIKPKYSFDCSHQYINGFLFITYGLLIPLGWKFDQHQWLSELKNVFHISWKYQIFVWNCLTTPTVMLIFQFTSFSRLSFYIFFNPLIAQVRKNKSPPGELPP